MARTYKKRSKKKPNKSHKKMHRYRRKFKRAGVGSLTSLRAAKTIQSAFRENTTRRKASALRQRHSAKKIQRKIHKAFDFTADNCAVCIDKLALKSKVSTLSCKHGLHKECITALKKSEAFKDMTKRRCPMCRTHVKELQMIGEVNDDYDNQIKELIPNVINNPDFPQELVSPENIERFKEELFTECKYRVNRQFRSNATHQDILGIIMGICGIIKDCFEKIKNSLSTINSAIINPKTGKYKRISKDTLEKSIKHIHLTNILHFKQLLNKININLPDTIEQQIQRVINLLLEKNIQLPSEQAIITNNNAHFHTIIQ